MRASGALVDVGRCYKEGMGANEPGRHKGKGPVARSGWLGAERELWELAHQTPPYSISEDADGLRLAGELDVQARQKLRAYLERVNPARVAQLLEELARLRVASRELMRAVRAHPDLSTFVSSSFMRDDFDEHLRLSMALLQEALEAQPIAPEE